MKNQRTEVTPPKNPRHQLFADRVLEGDSITDAYLTAGFKVSRDMARKNAPKLRQRPDVVAYITAVQAKSAEAAVLSLLDKRLFLARIVRTPINHIDPNNRDDPNADLIRKFKRRIRTEEDETEWEYQEFEKLDPLKAIDLDNKLSGDDPEANLMTQFSEALRLLGNNSPLPAAGDYL